MEKHLVQISVHHHCGPIGARVTDHRRDDGTSWCVLSLRAGGHYVDIHVDCIGTLTDLCDSIDHALAQRATRRDDEQRQEDAKAKEDKTL